MAFHFGQSSSPQANASSVNVGAQLPEIFPEVLGFHNLSAGKEGAKKLKLLPSPWPSDNAPPAASSLLSIASKRGLLAAAGPDTLVIASTDKVRKAFDEEAGESDVVSNFRPDITLPVPQLRHVAFSHEEDFLVITAENGGGLAVYSVDDLLQQKKDPGQQISTDEVPVRALLPNPNPMYDQYMAIVLDSGRLAVADVSSNTVKTLRADGVACAAWSVKGKAVVAGLNDGTAAMYVSGDLKGIIPCPPDVDESYAVSAVYWLNNDEVFLIHSPQNAIAGDGDAMQDEKDNKYHFVKMDKNRTVFTFHPLTDDILYPTLNAPDRKPPPRFSVTRLRNWEPLLQDMLILTGSNTPVVAVITSTSETIAPDQKTCNDYVLTTLLDNRQAQVPQMAFDEEGDSSLIGEALDLSGKEKILRPIPQDHEINQAPFTLPAYFALTHQGLLAAWWIVWDKSIREQKAYPGLYHPKGADVEPEPVTSAPSAPTESKPESLFGQSASNTSKPAAATQTSSAFGQPAAAFGTPSTPKFGSTGFGTGTPAFSKPSQPAFGATSAIGGASAVPAFGSTGGLGNKQSPWATTSQTPASQQSNPFAAAASEPSGFAKFGANTLAGGSAFSSFGSNTSSQSPFTGLGQQKSAFAGTSNAFKGLSTEPSFGSTVTIGSGTGSTLPSWANTPAQHGSSAFGQPTSSFGSSKESDMSDADDTQNRERDGETPTPQAPQPQTKGLFGLPANGFKLGSTSKEDGSAKDDLTKPAAPSESLFGNDFATTLGEPASNPPATPVKPDEQEKKAQDASTTPASPAKSLFPSTTFGKQTTTPKAPAPMTEEATPVPEEAPLPPDPMTWKVPEKADDDIPPLAGSPAIKVEAPESSVPSSPLEDDEDEGGDFSVEEQEGDEETEEPSPSDAARRSRPSKGWTFQDSVNQSPRIFPAAPTPPTIKSRTSSQSGRSTSPARPLFGQSSKPAVPSPFSQPTQASPFSFEPAAKAAPSTAYVGFPKPAQSFAPPVNRAQARVRSPSPVRSASTSALSTARREPLTATGVSLSVSTQRSKPPSPQPEISDLEDDEDTRIRDELSRPVEPSRMLDSFLAHQDYAGRSPSKTGHAAQIELMYRDINSMVDTLGLNSRSLQAFIKYHDRPQHDGDLARSDLEDINGEFDGPWFEKWCLCEINDLKTLEDELEQELDEGRVHDVLDKLSQLARLLREKAKLMTRLNGIRRQIINRKDPEKVEALRKAPLPKELADGQKALRNDYARLLTLLNQAEEATVLLRSRLASRNAENGKIGAVPTVDAVKKTIIKMTALAEKRNNDIVLLESQMRKVGLVDSGSRPTSSSSRHFGTPRRSRGLRGDSPLATPPTNKSRMSMSLTELNRRALTPEVETTPSKGYGLYYTPEGSPTPGRSTDLARLEDLVDDNIVVLRKTARRRRKVAGGLRSALVERGVKTTIVN